MSSVYSNHADSPNAIVKEGQEVTLKFTRTSDSTGTITWNIPPGTNGCDSDGKYDGIVITVANKPVNYNSTSPTNQKYYNGDPTVDPDLHTGDKLDYALILFATYNDRVTTSLKITDLKPNVPYFISGYPVDNVGNYYRQGVHAYSLPTGPSEPNNDKDTGAIQDIGIETPDGIKPTTLTGLEENKEYFIKSCINNINYTLNIPGNQALDYDDLIFKINQEFIRLTEPKFEGPNPPNTGVYYVQLEDKIITLWDGFKEIPQKAIFQNINPAQPVVGTYSFDPISEILRIFEVGGFAQRTYTTSTFDFSAPKCNQYWFNGTDAFKWERTLWCQLPTFISTTNPLLPLAIQCNSFWYNTDTFILQERDIEQQKWVITTAIYSPFDPNDIVSGNFWFDQLIQKVKIFSSSINDWNILNNVTYVERDENGEFPGTPFANIYWFIPSEQKLLRRNTANTEWIEQVCIIYDKDPRDRKSCENWWDSDDDVLYKWDIINSRWVVVNPFFQTNIDPALPPDIPPNSAWFNPDTEVLTIINNPDCDPVNYVFSQTDPTVVELDEIWFEPVSNVFRIWNGSGWQIIDVNINDGGPLSFDLGELWYDTAANKLYKWSGSNFAEVNFSTTTLVPEIGDLWFNVDNLTLFEWNGITWVETIGIAAAKLILRNPFACKDCKAVKFTFLTSDFDLRAEDRARDVIRFYTKATGCEQTFDICVDGDANFLFSKLKQPVIYFEPLNGSTALESGPMYLQVGVGTDGSPDERRQLQANIRTALGGSGFTVELTKDDLDECINNAFLNLRKYSSYSTTRNFFFLNIKPNQQTYILKDKCVGFNKIVSINSIHRFRGGFFGRGANDSAFGYAALQTLYNFGGFDMLSYHLVANFQEELDRLLATEIMFQFTEHTRELRMYQPFAIPERVLLDVNIEKTEQNLLTDRNTRLWIKKWATAEAKLILGNIRGKYVTLPGPNGSTQLNGSDLIQNAKDEMEALKEELLDLGMQDIVEQGMRTWMIMG